MWPFIPVASVSCSKIDRLFPNPTCCNVRLRIFGMSVIQGQRGNCPPFSYSPMTKAVIFLCGRSIEVERPSASERTNDRLIDGASDGRGRCAEFYSERGKRKKERKEEGNEDGGEQEREIQWERRWRRSDFVFDSVFRHFATERNAQIAM